MKRAPGTLRNAMGLCDLTDSSGASGRKQAKRQIKLKNRQHQPFLSKRCMKLVELLVVLGRLASEGSYVGDEACRGTV
jgi:hypothetical protein